ncbi:MAG: MJ1477/TM1410 family putative glycoside hydrolase [Hyphomicrobiaceae bacterium]
MKLIKFLFCAALTLLAAAPVEAQTPQRANPFAGAKSWAYQLTNLGAEQQKRIIDSDYDVVVVDYARSLATDATEVPLTPQEVAAMKRKPDGSRRVVIAYLSIGESEDNRYYWPAEWNKKRPAYMKGESKEWKGNYLVEYWNPTWQKIIFGTPDAYVDRILKGGFDGFYIDRADAYYRFGDTKQARDRMTDFVVRLIADIRSKKPDAAIMMQNAEELLDRPEYLSAIDAIAKEDLLFGITHREELNKKVDIDYSTKALTDAQKAGKAIFVVEYLRNPKNIEMAKARMKELGFVLYYGPRGLFEIMKPGETPAAPPPRTVTEKVKSKLPFVKQKATPGARNVR